MRAVLGRELPRARVGSVYQASGIVIDLHLMLLVVRSWCCVLVGRPYHMQLLLVQAASGQ
jgi:hypothetical protein